MEKLNCEKQSKLELQEEMYSLQDEIGSLQTQLLRHRDEIEELSSLYEAEKLQNCVLEEALQEEKDIFNKMIAMLITPSPKRCRSDWIYTNWIFPVFQSSGWKSYLFKYVNPFTIRDWKNVDKENNAFEKSF